MLTRAEKRARFPWFSLWENELDDPPPPKREAANDWGWHLTPEPLPPPVREIRAVALPPLVRAPVFDGPVTSRPAAQEAELTVWNFKHLPLRKPAKKAKKPAEAEAMQVEAVQAEAVPQELEPFAEALADLSLADLIRRGRL